MRRMSILLLLLVLLAPAAVTAADAQPGHQMVAADAVAWGPPPPALPPTVKIAVLAGDPAKEGPFTLRLWAPDGFKVPPHWHPTTEHLTVVSGTFHLGMGETVDPAGAKPLAAGSFAVMPAEMRHWGWMEGDTVVQVHGTGPFALNYVNPADDPRNGAPAAGGAANDR